MPRLRVAIFLGIFSLILYVTNLVVYEALATIFDITAVSQLWALGAALGILSASFVLSTMLGMRYYNAFTRIYYTVSAVWIGLFVYLFLISVVYGLLAMLPGTLPTIVGHALVAVAVLASIYGVLHARKIYVTEVDVALAGLPAAWQGRKAVWTSDVHLGQLHGPAFARRVVDSINAIKHDMVFIGGDLFDGTGAPDIDELVAPFKDVAAPLGTYYITGNHEDIGSNEKFIAAVKGAGIRVLQDEKVDIDGVQLVGVDYHNASDIERYKTILSTLAIDSKKVSILLKHVPSDLDIAHAAGISLHISGHTHRAQMWPLEYVARMVYKGFAYGLKNLNEMQVFTSSGTGTWGPPLRVGTNGEIVVFTFRDE